MIVESSRAPLILDWPAAARAGPAHAGGKGTHLAVLSDLGVPVPPGFVIDAAASVACQPGAARQPSAAPQPSATSQPGAAPQTSARLSAIPDPLAVALSEELARRGWTDRPLAVRSSAVLEDSARASFAGIHRSCLNVRGLESVLKAVQAVWDSAYTPAAIAYRQRLNLSTPAAGMAVVVMPLLPAVASGIAFTCDPRSGRTDHSVIHAHWGLGEPLVAGEVDGDEYRLEWPDAHDTPTLISQHRGTKARMTEPADADADADGSGSGGTTRRDTPAALSARSVLSADQIATLARLVRDVAFALDYAEPFYDIEWVWDGQTFWIVQARPLTRRGRHTYPALAHQPAIWSRMNSREVAPDPFSALEWDISRGILNRMLTRSSATAGYATLPGLQRGALRHGRLYFETAIIQWEAFDAFGLLPRAATEMFGGHQPEIAVPAPTRRQRLQRAWRSMRYVARCARPRLRARHTLRVAHTRAAEWLSRTPPQSAVELARTLRERLALLRSADDLFFLQGSSASFQFMLRDLAEQHCPGEGPGLTAALLAGGAPSTTAAQAYALMDLARTAASDAPALAWLRSADRIGSDWSRQLEEGSPFRRAFAAFLERYGHRGVYESYLRNPRWREAPDYLLDSIVSLLDTDPAPLRRRQQETFTQARKRLKRALPVALRPLLGTLIRLAVVERNLREAGRSALIAHLEVIRRDALALGRHWTGPRGLAAPEDIFHLTQPEVFAIAEDTFPLHIAAKRAARRRLQWDQWSSETEPDVILEHDETARRSLERTDAERHALEQIGTARRHIEPTERPLRRDESRTETARAPYAGSADRIWQGTAVGSGLARGAAHIARHPSDALRMIPGAVLVTPSTDPAWTPSFLNAGALVMEMGGYLSHGAIVAREFGIPAIANLPGILDQLRDGDLLEVDGARGTVRRLQTAAKSAQHPHRAAQPLPG